ncbi:MAG: AMP-binding protein, partial [Xanthomonadales bacterium]|nr:AMP-binding protein [Xanthomonadales bacterium]
MTLKPWLEHYAHGVPADIDLSEYSSVVDVLERVCERFRDKTAFICMGSSITYGELDLLSRSFAATLQARGLKQGDRVALMMPNILQYPVALFGILRAGLTVVNTNPLYTGRELRHQLVDSGARAIVVIENFADVLERVREDVPVEYIFTTRVGDMLDFPKGAIVNFAVKHIKKAIPAWNLPGSERFSDALEEGNKLPFQPAQVGFEDLAFLQYTGGTTGVAKGAMLTHRNMVANMLQAKAWLGNLNTGEELVITALPM